MQKNYEDQLLDLEKKSSSEIRAKQEEIEKLKK